MTAATGTAGAVSAALTQIGLPYKWGAEAANVDFDCSGLTQWAYEQAGVQLPRTSEEQYTATTQVTEAQAKPGDLVFSEFGAQGQSGPGHVGIYIGNGEYIDAPYTGANVRIDKVPTGAVFGQVNGAPQTTTSTNGANPTGETGQLLDLIPGYQQLDSAASDASSISGLISDITSPTFWERIGMGALGVALFGVGLAIFFASTNTGKKAISDGAELAPLAAA